jgi:hypothetical protein
VSYDLRILKQQSGVIQTARHDDKTTTTMSLDSFILLRKHMNYYNSQKTRLFTAVTPGGLLNTRKWNTEKRVEYGLESTPKLSRSQNGVQLFDNGCRARPMLPFIGGSSS